MLDQDLAYQAKKRVKQGYYRLTLHAETERERDSLMLKEVEECFLGGTIEIIEDYPEDPRGHSFLLLGFTEKGQAVHFVCALHEKELVIITLYKPDERKWRKFRERIK